MSANVKHQVSWTWLLVGLFVLVAAVGLVAAAFASSSGGQYGMMGGDRG